MGGNSVKASHGESGTVLYSLDTQTSCTFATTPERRLRKAALNDIITMEEVSQDDPPTVSTCSGSTEVYSTPEASVTNNLLVANSENPVTSRGGAV